MKDGVGEREMRAARTTSLIAVKRVQRTCEVLDVGPADTAARPGAGRRRRCLSSFSCLLLARLCCPRPPLPLLLAACLAPTPADSLVQQRACWNVIRHESRRNPRALVRAGRRLSCAELLLMLQQSFSSLDDLTTRLIELPGREETVRNRRKCFRRRRRMRMMTMMVMMVMK
eukprot:670008-Hanusia_phi.AAC.2